ncbi:hypothetical protein ACIOHO_25940 [Streptomyces sp. NPDC087849]|uniref:hypothetical protein n=1 Tax=Streptomyces sp. NPDC087849 TaxID=3365808 RepID=UPI003807F012
MAGTIQSWSLPTGTGARVPTGIARGRWRLDDSLDCTERHTVDNTVRIRHRLRFRRSTATLRELLDPAGLRSVCGWCCPVAWQEASCAPTSPAPPLAFERARTDGTWDEQARTETTTLGAHCDAGCNVTLRVQDNVIVEVATPHDNPVTHGSLRIKGRFGFHHVQNRVQPLWDASPSAAAPSASGTGPSPRAPTRSSPRSPWRSG